MTDSALIDRWLAGESQALDLLVRRHAPWLTRWLAVRLPAGQGHEAEDLAQEVFVVVIRKLDGLKGCEAYPVISRSGPEGFVATRGEDADCPAVGGGRRPTQSQPELAECREDEDRLQEAIRGLPEELELTLLAYYSRNVTYEELAELLGCPGQPCKAGYDGQSPCCGRGLSRNCPHRVEEAMDDLEEQLRSQLGMSDAELSRLAEAVQRRVEQEKVGLQRRRPFWATVAAIVKSPELLDTPQSAQLARRRRLMFRIARYSGLATAQFVGRRLVLIERPRQRHCLCRRD